MNEATQGATCRQCKETVLIWDLAVITDNPTDGRMHTGTCLQCIKKLNGLVSK